MSLNASAVECVHLVLHQRDQRRDDKGNAFKLQGGKLKDERLARARRHDDEGYDDDLTGSGLPLPGPPGRCRNRSKCEGRK